MEKEILAELYIQTADGLRKRVTLFPQGSVLGRYLPGVAMLPTGAVSRPCAGGKRRCRNAHTLSLFRNELSG